MGYSFIHLYIYIYIYSFTFPIEFLCQTHMVSTCATDTITIFLIFSQFLEKKKVIAIIIQ
jgi:hypothetical protein